MRSRVSILLACLALAYLGNTYQAYAEGKLYVTPRAWYAWTTEQRTYRNNSDSGENQIWQIPLFGGSVSYVPSGQSGYIYSLTGFYGEDNGRSYTDFNGSGKGDIHRLDIEATLQMPIGSSGAGWVVGVRYVSAESDIVSDPTAMTSYRYRSDLEFYLAELGISTSSPLDEAGLHRFFGGAIMMIGYNDVDVSSVEGTTTTNQSRSGGVIGFDANAGYAYSMSGFGTLSARYRVFAISGTNFDLSGTSRFVHGPEVNVTIPLN